MESEEFAEFPGERFIRIESIDAWAVIAEEVQKDGDGEVYRIYEREIQIYMNGQDDPFKFIGEDSHAAEKVLKQVFSISPLDVG